MLNHSLEEDQRVSKYQKRILIVMRLVVVVVAIASWLDYALLSWVMKMWMMMIVATLVEQ